MVLASVRVENNFGEVKESACNETTTVVVSSYWIFPDGGKDDSSS